MSTIRYQYQYRYQYFNLLDRIPIRIVRIAAIVGRDIDPIAFFN
ncbi:hypothetical protein [Pseudanabaena sp. PCC 6802]|nr:hypothetical protein [Pseudanabaena sp. PCC 6802]